MFPIPFNFPFRKKDGSLSTIGDEINAGGGGSSYTLPTASANVKGGVKIGEGLSMDGDVLNNTNPTPATPYTLPTASDDTLGGVKVGSGLAIDENGVLSTSGGGGGSKYLHIISCTPSGYNFSFMILNGSSAALTYENIYDYLSSFAHNGNKLYPASGFVTADNKSVVGVKRPTSSSDRWRIKVVSNDRTEADIAYSSAFTDNVITF